MYLKKPDYLNSLFLILFLVTACAKISGPTGGDRDVTQPDLVYQFPDSGQTNFRGKKILLEFDEYIRLKPSKTSIIITPNTGNEYTTKHRKNIIELEFENSLEDSTTYTILFVNAIEDINESNKIKKLKLAFSTGDYLDSGSLNGVVKDHLTKEPQKNMLVALIKPKDTIGKNEPIYLTFTNEEGEFQITNIKTGNYKLYTINDVNQNFKYDERNETIGFLDSTIYITSDSSFFTLSTFQTSDTEPRLNKSLNRKKYSIIGFNKIVILDSIIGLSESYEIVREKKDFKIFHNLTVSKNIIVYYHDSVNHYHDTTVTVKPLNYSVPEYDSLTEIIYSISQYKDSVNIEVTNETPFKLTRDSLLVSADSTEFNKIHINARYETNQKLNVTLQTAFEDSLRVKLNYSTFTDFFGRVSIDTSFSLIRQKPKKYSSISGSVMISDSTQFIIHLLDRNFKILSILKNKKEFKFDQLDGGTYFLRLLIDEDNNGFYTKGSLEDLKQPEPIILREEPIQLKPNWDVDGIMLTID